MPKSANVFKTILVALTLAAAAGRLEAAPVRPDDGTIAGVVVTVDGKPAEADIEALILIAPGEPYSPKKIDAALKQIYQTGLFSDARVLKEGEREVRLTFLLTRRLLTRSIAIRGERALSARKMKEGLYALRSDGDFSEDRLARAAGELKDVLRREGYLGAEVQTGFEKDAVLPLVDVVFDVAAGSRRTIRKIDFLGGSSAPVPALVKTIQSREGKPYIPSLLESDVARIKSFYAALGYPRADISLDPVEPGDEDGTVALAFRINPHERIRISIAGAKIPESLVRPIWEEPIFEEWGLLQTETALLSYLRDQGFVFATAKASLEKAAGELRVACEVNPGRKYTIYDVEFEGHAFFTPVELKRQMGIGLSLAILGGISGKKLFEMPARIVELYETKGFPEARVDLDFRMIGSDMRAIYHIEEGFQRTIGRLSWSGVSLFDTGVLRGQIGSAESGPFFQPEVQKDIGRLEAFYLNQGVRGTIVTAAVEQTDDRRFAVTFRIEEGRRVRIGRIIVAGQRITRRRTIDREIKIREGEPAAADRILETKRGLEKLGVFSEVKIEEIPTSTDAENLVISLREGQRNYVSLGAGLETKTATQSLEIWENGVRPRGTAELILGNVLGRASQLSFVTQFSLKETRGVVSWEDRTLFGLPFQTALNGWLEREERPSYGYDQRGVSGSAIQSFGAGWVSYTTLRWARTTLYFLDVAESAVDRQHYPFSIASVTESLILDRRDDGFNPERGSFFSAVVEWAYPLFNVESDFLKSIVKYQRFFPVLRTMNFCLTARAGLGMGRIPIHERFFAGGSNSFRGETFDELGPLDPSSQKPIGGKALILFNFELRFPIFRSVENLTGAVFYDKGNVFAARSDVRIGGLEDAFGLGIRYRTPLGPLRIDLGWNLHPRPGRAQPSVFVTIGNIF